MCYFIEGCYYRSMFSITYVIHFLFAHWKRTLALYVKRRGLRKKYVHMILKLLNLTWMQSMFERRIIDHHHLTECQFFAMCSYVMHLTTMKTPILAIETTLLKKVNHCLLLLLQKNFIPHIVSHAKKIAINNF